MALARPVAAVAMLPNIAVSIGAAAVTAYKILHQSSRDEAMLMTREVLIEDS